MPQYMYIRTYNYNYVHDYSISHICIVTVHTSFPNVYQNRANRYYKAIFKLVKQIIIMAITCVYISLQHNNKILMLMSYRTCAIYLLIKISIIALPQCCVIYGLHKH